MTVLKAIRTSQRVMASEFVFNFGDTMVDINGVSKLISADGTFTVINLPMGAVVTLGSLIVEVAGAGTVAFGTAAVPAGFLAATSAAAAGYTPLTGFGLLANDGSNVVMTVAGFTSGKARIRVTYTIDGKADDVIPN
jgi:hypothetical protein